MEIIAGISIVMMVVWFYQLKRSETEPMSKYEMRIASIRTEIQVVFIVFATIAVVRFFGGIM